MDSKDNLSFSLFLIYFSPPVCNIFFNFSLKCIKVSRRISLHYNSFSHSWGHVNISKLSEGRLDLVGPGHRWTSPQLWLGTWCQWTDQSERWFPSWLCLCPSHHDPTSGRHTGKSLKNKKNLDCTCSKSIVQWYKTVPMCNIWKGSIGIK